jgi:integrase
MRIRELYTLRASQIRNAKVGKLSDGGGLILVTKAPGRQYWYFRHKVEGKDRTVALGSTELITLAQARDKAGICREAVMQGKDPKEALLGDNVKSDAGPTFKMVAQEYIEVNQVKWGAESLRQWRNTLRDYVYPSIGSVPISELTVEDIYQLLLNERFWYEKNPTASKVRGRIAKVWGFGKTRRMCSGPNPASWGDNLENLLPSSSDVHTPVPHEAMPRQELRVFVPKLEAAHESGRDPVSAQCLYWLILSAARYSEAAGATFDEIKDDRWVIPAHRMKNGIEHIVPLTTPMLQLLKKLEANQVSEYMFATVTRKRTFGPMSENTMTKYLKSHTKPIYTTHGLRSTFKDWATEETNYDDMLSEVALSHVVGSEVRRAYARGSMIERRREMMGRWADFVRNKKQGKVVKIA